MKDQKPWCIWPYFNLSVRSNGTVGPCCVWPRASLDKPSDLSSQIFSDLFENIRQQHAAGIIPKECNGCVTKDRIGGNSVRALGFGVAESIDYDHSMGPMVFSQEVNLSNTCNIKCRTCDSDSSTKWIVDEQILLSDPRISNIHKHHGNGKSLHSGWELDEETASTIRRLEFLGGEPTLHQDEITRGLELIDKHGRLSEIVIDITTNGMKPFNDKLLDLLLGCKIAHVNVSIDGYGKLNDYIRSDSEWDRVSEMLKHLDQIQMNRKTPLRPQIVSLCSIYNVNELWKLWTWARDNLSAKCQHVGLIMLYGPTFMDSRMLKPEHKQIITDRLLSKLSELPMYEPEIRSIVRNLRTELDDAELRREQFRMFNSSLDSIRKTNLRDANPEIDAWLGDFDP